MKHKIHNLILVLLAVSIAFPACGTGTENNDPPSGDFPIPYPEGGKIITDERDGETGYMTLQYEEGLHEEVVAFYDDYTKTEEWNRSENGQGEVPAVNYVNLMDGLVISIGPPNGQVADAFLVTLTAG